MTAIMTRSRLSHILCSSVAVCLLTVASCSTGPKQQFRAGAAAVDITPQQWPLPLIGSFSYRPASSAHDPLHARALVLDDGHRSIALVVIDSCYVARQVLDEAKRRAWETTGIPTDHMLMSATHTHTAPAALAREPTEPEKHYTELLTRQIAGAVQQAAERLEPAEIGWGRGEVPEELFNRRWFMKPGTIPPNPFGETTDQVRMNPPGQSPDLIRPAGPTDPEVSVVSVRATDGRPLALLANYSLHYVGGVPPGQVSADYFGEFARLITAKISPGSGTGEFVGILSNGTSGDVNNINFTQARPKSKPFERIRTVAKRVVDAAHEAYKGMEYQTAPSLAMAEKEITLAVRKPTTEGYEKAKQVLATKDESKLPRRAKPYAERAICLYEGPDTVAIKLQAIRIGELGIAAIPFEVFTEIGLEIKEKSPLKPTFTMELANGANGYLPTPEQHALGGYETWLGTNRVEIEASRKITATIFELLRQVAERD